MNDYLHGIAISKIFHQDLGLWRNGIAEGYYRLGVDDIVYAIAWVLVISSGVYNLIRMAAGSPRGAKQLLLVGVSSMLLGLTPQIRGDENSVGWLWGFYHSIYSKLYVSTGQDAQGNPKGPALAGLAVGNSVREALEQQIQAAVALARLQAEVATIDAMLGTLTSKATQWGAKIAGMIGAATQVATGNVGGAAATFAITSAISKLSEQLRKFLNRLDEGLNNAVNDLVRVAVTLMQEHALIIYATATIIIFISLFWPLLAALLAFPQTAPAFVTAIGLIPGAILALVMSGTLLLTGLAVVFRTTAGVLTEYNKVVGEATSAISEMQSKIQNVLNEGAKEVEKSKDLLEGGKRNLENQKLYLQLMINQGQEDPKTTIARTCKLKIEKGEIVSKLVEDTECIGGTANANVGMAEIEEYLNHYERMERQYYSLVERELGDPNAFHLNFVERAVNGLLGVMARFTIQLQITRIMGIIVGIVSILFLVYVASLGTKVGVEFIRHRIGL